MYALECQSRPSAHDAHSTGREVNHGVLAKNFERIGSKGRDEYMTSIHPVHQVAKDVMMI